MCPHPDIQINPVDMKKIFHRRGCYCSHIISCFISQYDLNNVFQFFKFSIIHLRGWEISCKIPQTQPGKAE